MADEREGFLETAKEHNAAVKIIAGTIRELASRIVWPDGSAEGIAEAIIARLTRNDPPLLIVFAHNVKD